MSNDDSFKKWHSIGGMAINAFGAALVSWEATRVLHDVIDRSDADQAQWGLYAGLILSYAAILGYFSYSFYNYSKKYRDITDKDKER